MRTLPSSYPSPSTGTSHCVQSPLAKATISPQLSLLSFPHPARQPSLQPTSTSSFSPNARLTLLGPLPNTTNLLGLYSGYPSVPAPTSHLQSKNFPSSCRTHLLTTGTRQSQSYVISTPPSTSASLWESKTSNLLATRTPTGLRIGMIGAPSWDTLSPLVPARYPGILKSNILFCSPAPKPNKKLYPTPARKAMCWLPWLHVGIVTNHISSCNSSKSKNSWMLSENSL